MLTSIIDSRMLEDVHRRSLDRLVQCVSRELFAQIMETCLREIGTEWIGSPQQLLRLGDSMISHGKATDPQYSGTVTMMGRLMRTRAILLGARV
jgi:hypothetical protein